jgi:tetratricopeptide (TPR) repeat protein
MKNLLLAALLLCSLASLRAQDEAKLSIETADGRVEHVVPLAVEGGNARYKAFVLGGEMTTTRKLSDLTPESAFAFEVAVANPKTSAACFEFAKKAASMRLMQQAGVQARRAVELAKGAPDEAAQVAAIRSWGADLVESVCKAAVERKDLAVAQRALSVLTSRLADQRTEEQIAQLSASVEQLHAASVAAAAADRKAKVDAKKHDDLHKKMKPIQDKVAQGDKLQGQGFAKSKNTSQSAKLCEQSIDAYKAAGKALQELGKQIAEDSDLANEARAIGAHIHDSGIRSALHVANMLTVQSDFKNALDWTSRILAFDPGNLEAKAMRHTIEVAQAEASESWRWNWHVVGDSPRPSVGQRR